MDLVNQSGQTFEKSLGNKKSWPKPVYFILMVLSAVVTWAIFLRFLFSDDASLNTFFQQPFATAISALWTSDVLMYTLVFFIFAGVELKRLGAPAGWLAVYFATTLAVGPCFSLPLFLYQRETWRARTQLAQG